MRKFLFEYSICVEKRSFCAASVAYDDYVGRDDPTDLPDCGDCVTDCDAERNDERDAKRDAKRDAGAAGTAGADGAAGAADPAESDVCGGGVTDGDTE